MSKPDIVSYRKASVLKTVFVFFVIIILIFIQEVSVKAQDNTLYNMSFIPQANQLNPALMRSCGVYVELPVLSSVGFNIRNTGFGFHDVIHRGVGAQSATYSPDLSNLDKILRRMNYFRTDVNIDLLGFGFPVQDWYLTFGIANHNELRVGYPHDIASLKDGNWDVSKGDAIPVKMNGLGIDFTAWNSIGISAAREITDGLRVGLRIKYLQGMANINTRNSKLELNTSDNPITLEAIMKYRLNASLPVDLGYASNGLVNNINYDNTFNNLAGDYLFNGNRGLSVDAGIIFDMDEVTQFTASIVDLGFIRWKKNVNNFEAGGQGQFNGIDFDQYQLNPGQLDFLDALQDSIFKAFNAVGSTKKYFTMTTLKMFGGGTRELLPNLEAGVLAKIEIFDLRFRPSLTFSLNYVPLPWVATTLSYSIMNNKLNQVGAGLAFGNRGAQFYILTDNIPVRFTKNAGSSIIWPYNARMLSLRFGFNLLFGCREQENKYPRQKSGKNDICPAYW
jgi:hypothetical protein